ncbi:MAG: hypothetical protein RL042_317 [Nitrospirota bacterium]
MMSLKDLTDLIQSGAVIIASIVAIYGITAWRVEFVGKRRIELAEEVLALFYQAQDIINSIRSSFGYEGEGRTRKPGPNESPKDKDALNQAYVLIERYNRHTELFSRLHALRYRFMAQFGPDASAPFDDLNRIINELLLSAKRKARLAIVSDTSLRSEAALERYHQEWLEIERVYYSGEEDDPIAPRLVKIISDIESTCRPIIEKS